MAAVVVEGGAKSEATMLSSVPLRTCIIRLSFLDSLRLLLSVDSARRITT